LNTLVTYTDSIKQSASASRRRVFVVEVQGGNCGYIASYIGLVSGAVSVYTPERELRLQDIQEDISLLKENFKNDQGETKSGKILIRNELCSEVYTTDLIANIIEDASNKKFGVRTAVPGHVQQGGTPSTKDRVVASRFAVKCVKFIEEFNQNLKKNQAHQVGSDSKVLRFYYDKDTGKKVYTCGSEELENQSACVICINGTQLTFKPIQKIWDEETNEKLRKGNDYHWEEINKVSDMISGRLMLRRELLNEN